MQRKIVDMNDEYLKRIATDLKEYDHFWNEKILKDEFENPNSKYFVICDSDEIFGFAGLWFNIDEAHIMNIAVREKYRKMGIGSELLEYMIGVAKSFDKNCITLEVREDNAPAIGLYEKFDFSVDGRRTRYYHNLVDAIIMTKFF